MNVGVIAPWAATNADADVEVRAFMGEEGAEDPVTGSLNASLAQWLIGAAVLAAPYTVSQGTALARRGRLAIDRHEGTIWVGGRVQRCITGQARF